MPRSISLSWLFGLTLAGVTLSPLAHADDAACIAASEQSLTLRQQGKLRDTMKALVVCADPACPDEVRAECAKRVDTVNAATPTLILSAKDGSGNDLYDVTVTMDGAPLLQKLDGLPLSLDPGEHTFDFQVTGQPPLEKKFVLREGEKDRREGVVIGTAPVTQPLTPPPPPVAPSSWNTQKTLALVSGGVGVVGVGLGVVFGLYASSAHSKEQTDCASAGACTNPPQATEDYNTAKSNALGSTISFIAGGVFLAGGVVLWVTAPKPKEAPTNALHDTPEIGIAPLLTPGGGGLMLRGSL